MVGWAYRCDVGLTIGSVSLSSRMLAACVAIVAAGSLRTRKDCEYLGQDLRGIRFSNPKRIDETNVPNLARAWTSHTRENTVVYLAASDGRRPINVKSRTPRARGILPSYALCVRGSTGMKTSATWFGWIDSIAMRHFPSVPGANIETLAFSR
jgi:hypothetical protein